MSDSRNRFRAVLEAHRTLYLENPEGNLARRLNTLAAMISGVVGN